MKFMNQSVASTPAPEKKKPKGRKDSTASTASSSKFAHLHDQNDQEYACRVCRVNVDENGCWCDRCKQWIHSKCSGLTRAEFDALAKLKNPGIKYFCPLCLGETDEGGDIDGKTVPLRQRWTEY